MEETLWFLIQNKEYCVLISAPWSTHSFGIQMKNENVRNDKNPKVQKKVRKVTTSEK
jgi:hypothetical protein